MHIRVFSLPIREKKRFARGTLLAPMQLPTRVIVAYWTPSGTIQGIVFKDATSTWDACSGTPNVPERTTRISKAHHSAQTITVEGSEISRY